MMCCSVLCDCVWLCYELLIMPLHGTSHFGVLLTLPCRGCLCCVCVLCVCVHRYARMRASDAKYHSPFSYAAIQAGYVYLGGKMDDITVVVSFVGLPSAASKL